MSKDYMDALHIASSCVGNCSHFITCDDELTNRKEDIENLLKDKGFSISVRNPIDFIKEMEDLI